MSSNSTNTVVYKYACGSCVPTNMRAASLCIVSCCEDVACDMCSIMVRVYKDALLANCVCSIIVFNSSIMVS